MGAVAGVGLTFSAFLWSELPRLARLCLLCPTRQLPLFQVPTYIHPMHTKYLAHR